ncbi:acyl-peptide hydrolase [Saccharomonospora piscinae]|uniref:Acyl-peptide hydrolase n=1 Tax=Saccharomonospora piscinae TaxID=687388 RepID=A0A1V9AC96_SACPI|nr:prolyl oligopeptidase family serine peptidase [Saccharomonospora piscinae]OQO94752.1 acyl-peptide hydrolase [Saccharomonospora piscinae]
MPTITPYGSWTSPISARDVAGAGTTPHWVDVVDGAVWWAESRPHENGRVALVRWVDGAVQEMLPAPWSARNRVHEYGGRPWLLRGDTLVFTHWDDQRLYALDLRAGPGAVTPLTAEPDTPQGVRFADLCPGPPGEVWAVRETALGPGRADVARDLVAVPLSGGSPRPLAASHHFLTAPRLAPDGRHAAWLGWDHPAMPWDTTSLCVAEVLGDGTLGPHRVLAGDAATSVCQLDWDGPDALIAITDPGGWWVPHRINLDGAAEALTGVEAELGGPLWKLGSRWTTPLGGGRHAVLTTHGLAVLDESTGAVSPVAEGELTAWTPTLARHGDAVVGVAAGPARRAAVVRVHPGDGTITDLTDPAPGPASTYLPEPRIRSFPAGDGSTVPAYVYPPANPDHTGPEGQRPPYLVHAHGGPTGRHHPALELDFAFFTSRGIGVVAVDYGGSTGRGRAYRERLRGGWGVVDVDDCAAVAQALVAEGLADPDRLAIRGGSAGGFTAAASATTRGLYRAATAKYPILDLRPWTGDGGETHDFESRYVEGLVGPLPDTEGRYTARSPLHNLGGLAGPVLLLQGEQDEICPPEQAERFVAALRGSGVPHALVRFPGEQHGFRRAETMVTALETELAFYGHVFGFDTPGVPPVRLRR